MRAVLLFVLLWGVTKPSAMAADYPFTGYFTIAGNPAEADPLDATRCALSFFRQEPNGDFVSYHLDRDLLLQSGELRYVVFQRGRCSYQASTKVETCHAAFDTNEADQGGTYYSAIDAIEADYVFTVTFDTLTAALGFSQRGDRSGGSDDAYYRCRFDEARLEPALSNDASTLDLDARDALTATGSAFLSSSEVTAVARNLGLVP